MADDRPEFEEEYAEDAFISAVENNEPATTAEIAEEVGCTASNALYRLKKLRARGLIDGKLSGNWMWFSADDRNKKVINAIREVEAATAPTISEMVELDVDVVEEVLAELHEKEIVENRQVPGKETRFWYLPNRS